MRNDLLQMDVVCEEEGACVVVVVIGCVCSSRDVPRERPGAFVFKIFKPVPVNTTKMRTVSTLHQPVDDTRLDATSSWHLHIENWG